MAPTPTLPLTPALLEPVLPLASGGMGSVELVVLRQGQFQRLFARKRMHPHLAGDPAARAMFLEEARVAGLIHHPNVAGVLAVGEAEDGPYLVMDYVDGLSGSELVASVAGRGLLPVQLCVRLAAQTARGLAAAHELRDAAGRTLTVVHRDVSLQNVLIGFDGIVRVTDFGVAKALDVSQGTAAGVLKGKLGYMAPERLRYEPATPRSDLYSLGVVLYELLAGGRLYAAGSDSDGVARRILEEPAPDIGLVREDVPSALVELLFELLAKDPAARPARAAEVAERLERISLDLALDEEPLDPAAWLAAHLSERRAHHAARVAEALGRPRSDASAPTLSMAGVPPARANAASRAGLPLALLGTLAALALLALVVAWLALAPTHVGSGVAVPSGTLPGAASAASALATSVTPSAPSLPSEGPIAGTSLSEMKPPPAASSSAAAPPSRPPPSVSAPGTRGGSVPRVRSWDW